MGEAALVVGRVSSMSSPSSSSSSSFRVPIDHEDHETIVITQHPHPTSLGYFLGLLRNSSGKDHVSSSSSRHQVCPVDEATTISIFSWSYKDEKHPDPKPNPNPDDWLPITRSRKGNTSTATFHLLCSGISYQSLLLPLAFVPLGWLWGTLCLALVFAWQLYTTWLLVHLHEPPNNNNLPGPRYSRYVVLSTVAFGPKLGKLLAIFPTMYLSGGTCVMFIITGGDIMGHLSRLIFCAPDGEVACQDTATLLTGAERFLIFVCLAILVSQFFPSLNSLAPIALLGSLAAVLYVSLLWILSITKSRPQGVSYGLPNQHPISEICVVRRVIDALGIISLTFRGHNLILEIQGTMPTNPQRPARSRMWKGVTASYVVIALCFFPLAIWGYWTYGNLMPMDGILHAFSDFHSQKMSKSAVGTIYSVMLLHLLCAFQLYSLPTLDNLERVLYVSKKNQACPRWLGSAIKVFFGGLTYFIAVAFPFLGSLGPFIGAITLPLSLAYPCFMWIAIRKPKSWSIRWCLNLGLGSLGIALSLLLAAAALWNLVANGLHANFLKPH